MTSKNLNMRLLWFQLGLVEIIFEGIPYESYSKPTTKPGL